MVTATAQWGAYGGWQDQRVVTDLHEALVLCAEIEASEGSGRCAMYWESVAPPYFQSIGSLAPDDPIDFAYDGQHTEFPGTVRISRKNAVRTLMRDAFVHVVPELKRVLSQPDVLRTGAVLCAIPASTPKTAEVVLESDDAPAVESPPVLISANQAFVAQTA